jgi:lipopolysaccharide transport system permease protein
VKPIELLNLPRLAIRHRELLGSFIWRDLKARYEGSLLGRLWPILNPLILFAVYYFVFAVVLQQKLIDRGVAVDTENVDSQQLMGLYIISGILPWICFSESLLRCTGVVLENGNLVKKIAFPSQLLPVYATIVNLVYMTIGLALFIVAKFVFFGGLPSAWPWLFVAVPLQFVFTLGIGLLLGALNIFIRDTSQIIGLILQLWFFWTPIVYPSSLVQKTLGMHAIWMQINPMYHLMELYRAALVYPDGIAYSESVAPGTSAAILAAMAIVTFVPGYAFFLHTKGRFADEL